MDVDDDGLDERLRRLAMPPSEVVERVVARAVAPQTPGRRHVPRLLVAASAACAVLLVMITVSYWPHPSATTPADVPAGVGIVLVRAPDGSSVIFSAGTPARDEAPGSGFVISEGGNR